MRVSCLFSALCPVVAVSLAVPLLPTPATGALLDMPSAAQVVLTGDRAGDLAGAALAVGDFDGDGHEDLAIGAPGGAPFRESRLTNGVVYLLFGGADFASRSIGTLGAIPNRIVGGRANASLGTNVAAGDFDGDGRDDLLIGAPWTTEGDSSLYEGGAAYLVLGRARGDFPEALVLPDSANATFTAPAASVHVGEAVALGDWNADGREDAAIGAMYANGPEGTRPHAGSTYVVFGRAARSLKRRAPIEKAADLTILGAERDDTSGRCLAFTDWNGDGREDLLIGAYYGDGPDNSRSDPGEAYIFLGGTKKGIRKKIADLATPGLAIPVYGIWDRGAFGRSAAVGDLDGDGLGDFVVAAYRAPDETNVTRGLAGVVDVLFGRREMPQSIDLATTREFRVLGASYYDRTGHFLTTGDLNGDGRADVLLGAPFGDATEADGSLRLQCGFVGVVMGRPRPEFPDSLDLVSGAYDHVLRGAEAMDQIPMGLAVLDIDADGKDDVVIGAPNTAGRDNARRDCGEIYFLLGASRSW